MGIFQNFFGKESKKSCCCEMKIVEVDQDNDLPRENDITQNASQDSILVSVLGPGCKKCHQLYENALEAAQGFSESIQIEQITDPASLADAGIMSTPALAVNKKIVSQGKVLSASEIASLLKS